MSKSKKAIAAKSANVTPVTDNVIEVTPAELDELILAEQTEELNDSVKLIIVRPDTTGGTKATKAGKPKVEVDPIPNNVLVTLATHNLNTVNSIKTLFASGYTRAQIIATGYNSSTVYRQVGEYVKSLEEVQTEKDVVVAKAEEILEEVNAEVELEEIS